MGQAAPWTAVLLHCSIQTSVKPASRCARQGWAEQLLLVGLLGASSSLKILLPAI